MSLALQAKYSFELNAVSFYLNNAYFHIYGILLVATNLYM